MKFKSALVTQVSGSVGGMTGSRNPFGMYFRARAIPVNPNTARQQVVRNSFNILAPRWSTVLTDLQRAQWKNYADVVQYTDSLGNDTFLQPMHWYIATNSLRLQQPFAVVDDAPSILSRATLTAPGITSLTASTGIAIVTFTNTDLWAGNAAGALMMWGGHPVSSATQFYNGPYRYAGRIAGATVPPTSPQNMPAWPFPLAAGQKVFGYFRAINSASDRRFSSPIRFSVTTV